MTELGNHTHVASNGRAEVGLNDLANLHGGLARAMLEISERATRCYQAAQARNRLVARHQLGELTKSLRLSVIVRPEYGEAIDQFIAGSLTQLRTTIDNEDWDHFEEVWESLTIAVNRNHEEFNHGYLVWRVPTDHASDLDLSPKD